MNDFTGFATEDLEKEIERRKREIPELISFNIYLHNEYTLSELQEYIEDQTDYTISDDLARKVSNEFYEVKFNCTLNTITGEVTSGCC